MTGVLEVPVLCFGFNNTNLPANTAADHNRNSSTAMADRHAFRVPPRSPTGSSRSMVMLSISEISHPTTPSRSGQTEFGTVHLCRRGAESRRCPVPHTTTMARMAYRTRDDDGIVDLVARCILKPVANAETRTSGHIAGAIQRQFRREWNVSVVLHERCGRRRRLHPNQRLHHHAVTSCGGTLIEIGVFCHEFDMPLTT